MSRGSTSHCVVRSVRVRGSAVVLLWSALLVAACPDSSDVERPGTTSGVGGNGRVGAKSGDVEDATTEAVVRFALEARQGPLDPAAEREEVERARELAARLGPRTSDTVAALRPLVLGDSQWTNVPWSVRRLACVLAAIPDPAGRSLLADILRERERLFGGDILERRATMYAAVRESLSADAARELLAIDDPELSSLVASQARDGPLATEIRPELMRLLSHADPYVRHGAALSVAVAVGTADDAELSTALFEFLDSAEARAGGDAQISPIAISRGEQTVSAVVAAVSRLRRGPELLAAWRHESCSELLRGYVTAHCAEVGGPVVERDLLLGLLADSPRYALRATCARALGVVGTDADLPTLARIGEGDPARIAGHHGASYPVRAACKAAAARIRSRLDGRADNVGPR